MRRRFIYDPEKDAMVEVSLDYESPTRIKDNGFQVMPDIQPYKSMITGEMITSRSHHRAHLKQHGCEEVGNDSSLHHEPRPLKSPPGLKEELIKAAYQTGVFK